MTLRTLGDRIDSWPRLLFAVVVGSLAILVCAWFYPPRIEVWSRRDTRLQEWSRADAFLKQCEAPLRQDIEPAVRWRLLPPLVCHALGLKGNEPLAFCWAGLAVFAVALAARLDGLTRSRLWAAIGAVGFATSGPFITALGWLGLNDGWYMLALLESAAGRSLWALGAWTFVGPWIDERFLIALPFALFVRSRLHPQETRGFRRTCLAACAGIAPYIVLRISFSLIRGDAVSVNYMASMIGVFRIYAAYVPLGWAMGYRAGWVALAASLLAEGLGWKSRLTGFALGAGGLIAISVAAWDIDRSTGILLPAYVLGIVVAARLSAAGRPRLLVLGLACVLLNLALPYAHIVGFTVSWNRGPFGIWRSLTGQ
jgi:MFS family permease